MLADRPRSISRFLSAGGTLDVPELKRALNILKGDAREAQASNDTLLLKEGTLSMWRHAYDMQAEFQQLLDADERAHEAARKNWDKVKESTAAEKKQARGTLKGKSQDAKLGQEAESASKAAARRGSVITH